MPTPLDLVRERAYRAGFAEAICADCALFRPNGDEMMGACQLTGEAQTRYGVCMSWTLSGEVPKPSPVPSPVRLEDGSIMLFGKAELPVGGDLPSGIVTGLICTEPGCGGRLELRRSHRINKWFYGCDKYPTCNGILPADNDGSPKGTQQTKVTRSARRRAHAAFDRLWMDGHARSRGAAYSWLAEVLGQGSAHMFEMDEAQCERVLLAVTEKGPGTDYWDAWLIRYRVSKHKRKGKRRKKKRAR